MATVTEKGIETEARMIANVSPAAAFTFLANGTGSGAESASDTALGSENTLDGSARAAAVCRYISPGIVQWSKLYELTGNITIQEVGIFNAGSGGDMFLRVLLPAPLTYTSIDSLEIIITHTVQIYTFITE